MYVVPSTQICHQAQVLVWGVVIWSHMENDADFWDKNIINECSFLCSKAKRYWVTQWDIFHWGKWPRGRMNEGWAGQNLSPSMSHLTEPHYFQLLKGWTFWGVETFKPAQLHPISQRPTITQQHSPSFPSDWIKVSVPAALPKSAVIVWFG